MDSADLEADLLRILGAWSAVSVAGGAVLWVAAERRRSTALRAFARQQVMWGAVDAAIAAVGGFRRRGSAPAQDPDRLRRILRINAVLDVGYVASGAALVALRGRIGSSSRYSAEAALGDGLGIIVQGGFLLLLDTTHAAR